MISSELVVPGSSTRLTSIEACRPEMQALHAHWLTMRGDRSMPARRDFNPATVRDLLPHLMLIDVFPQAPREQRYRVRLHGTAQVNSLGADWTGRFVHEMTDPEAADRLCAIGDHIVETHEPWMSTGDVYYQPNRPYSRFETILLPLSDDDATVNMVLGLTIFF